MRRIFDRICWAFMLLSALLLALSLVIPRALAQDEGWPRTLPVEDGLVTIYPLQVDGMEDNVIRYRAALAWREKPGAEPVFGAGWFESRVDIDRDNRIVHPRDLKVTNTRFPAGTDDIQASLEAALDRQAGGWNLDYSLDSLDSALASARAEEESLRQLNTAPPRIVYRDRPALLVTFDGEPILRDIEDSPYQAVINTPYPLISDGRRFYLNVARGAWYRADQATGPYRFETSPPPAIAALVKPEEAAEAGAEPATEAPAAKPITAANAPEIVVATEPTELIVTDGPAAFVPLVDDLLVLQNSDDDVFMDVASQKFYVVLAGRWFRSDSLNGPWEFRAADELPPAFAMIPENSEQADSRVYVAGTPEAEDAVLDAEIPQTAAVARGPADVDVDYDGEPRFAPVDGTDLRYAANSGSTVLQSDRTYYLVEDGVWYVADSPNGPWRVSDYRPDEVQAIAPTSPVYNVKYVYIYDSTPDVVYVGYTPGYLGSYVYYDTVVYGTGWYYRPWISPRYYYPRFSTWGFHVGYNPWSGWSFGLSWNWGWGSSWYASYGWGWGPYYVDYYRGGYWHHHHRWHHRHYGYWGPRGYCSRPPRYVSYPHHRDRYAYGRDGYGGYEYGRGRAGRHPNLYRDAGQRARVTRTYDKLPRERGWGDAAAAQVKNTAKTGNRLHQYRKPGNAKRDPAARYGKGPVKAADLRTKAGVRDANAAASRSLMLADRSGKVYPKPDVLRPTALRKATTAAGSKRAPNAPTAKARSAKTLQRPPPGQDMAHSTTVRPEKPRSSLPRQDKSRSAAPGRPDLRQAKQPARAADKAAYRRAPAKASPSAERPTGAGAKRQSTPQVLPRADKVQPRKANPSVNAKTVTRAPRADFDGLERVNRSEQFNRPEKVSRGVKISRPEKLNRPHTTYRPEMSAPPSREQRAAPGPRVATRPAQAPRVDNTPPRGPARSFRAPEQRQERASPSNAVRSAPPRGQKQDAPPSDRGGRDGGRDRARGGEKRSRRSD